MRVGVASRRTKRFAAIVMQTVYRPFLALALRFPKTVSAAVVIATVLAVVVAKDFGTSFLPPFREDAFNVVLSLPPGASLDESERVAEACVEGLKEIPGVKSVTRRTRRAERDQHAEPVSSSEFVVRVDLAGDVENVRRRIREQLGGIPGCSAQVGYPIAHRISAVLSGTESEVRSTSTGRISQSCAKPSRGCRRSSRRCRTSRTVFRPNRRFGTDRWSGWCRSS